MTCRQWVSGTCLLCRRSDQLVIFIGPVEVGGLSAPAFACGDCCEWCRWVVRSYHQQWDARPAM
ncbi:hypothetical protein SAMN05216489_04019 [Streptomyces sp. 3213]|nr:hypothetical protein SAMN05216489_04019 [Streptomyces sp. 3213] [Streptomyces sp. 3213.3]